MLPIDGNGNSVKKLEFSWTIRIKGSGNLLFVPAARDGRVSTSSSWSNPSFTGNALPDLRTVKDSGFVADWKVLALHGKFPQQWKKDSYDLNSAAFGVALMVPVDAYLQTTRSIKYSILVIVLTFTAFLLMEWVYDLSIHALQYILVGFALFGGDGSFYCFPAGSAIRVYLYPDPIAGLRSADGKHRAVRDPRHRHVFFPQDQMGNGRRRSMTYPPVPTGP